MWAAQFYPFQFDHQIITSGGLGTMGFGFPAAVGAQLAFPDKTVVAIVGDGGFQMTNQELAILNDYQINVKTVIINNGSLGMVRQWQENSTVKDIPIRFSRANQILSNYLKPTVSKVFA